MVTNSRNIENPVIKDRVRFLSLASGTGGTFTEIEVRLMPGGGTPLHFHTPLTETFEAVSGKLGPEAAGERFLRRPGQALTIGQAPLQRFYNPGNQPVGFKTPDGYIFTGVNNHSSGAINSVNLRLPIQ